MTFLFMPVLWLLLAVPLLAAVYFMVLGGAKACVALSSPDDRYACGNTGLAPASAAGAAAGGATF